MTDRALRVTKAERNEWGQEMRHSRGGGRRQRVCQPRARGKASRGAGALDEARKHSSVRRSLTLETVDGDPASAFSETAQKILREYEQDTKKAAVGEGEKVVTFNMPPPVW